MIIPEGVLIEGLTSGSDTDIRAASKEYNGRGRLQLAERPDPRHVGPSPARSKAW